MGNSTVFKGLAENILNRYKNRTPTNTWLSGDQSGSLTSGSAIYPQNQAKSETTYYHFAGNVNILETLNIPAGKTVIVEVDGKATITGNITYTEQPLASVNDIPQIIIFANNLDIAPSVTQIDAWLMIGINGATGTGTINTCNLYNNVGALYAVNIIGQDCNVRLKINGPVQARELKLFRTHGAGMGLGCGYAYNDSLLPVQTVYTNDNQAQWPNGGRYGAPPYKNCGSYPTFGSGSFPVDSATPAEVFNLRADAYLWAYRQAENYSQAFMTYSREVAPRY